MARPGRPARLRRCRRLLRARLGLLGRLGRAVLLAPHRALHPGRCCGGRRSTANRAPCPGCSSWCSGSPGLWGPTRRARGPGAGIPAPTRPSGLPTCGRDIAGRRAVDGLDGWWGGVGGVGHAGRSAALGGPGLVHLGPRHLGRRCNAQVPCAGPRKRVHEPLQKCRGSRDIYVPAGTFMSLICIEALENLSPV